MLAEEKALTHTRTDKHERQEVFLVKQDKQKFAALLKSSAFSNYLLFAFWMFVHGIVGKKYSTNAVIHFERLNESD